MSVFADYAKYYNLFYRDKDYAAEAAYFDQIIKRFHPTAESLLELGSGTGGHAVRLREKGYHVHGIDRSEAMLAEARKLARDGLTFSQGDIRELRLGKKFDGVFSAFHVMSYQTTDKDVIGAFQSASRHLSPGGLFIFDAWYGPGVLHLKPGIRENKFRGDGIFVLRKAVPEIRAGENVVDVKYHIHAEDDATGEVDEFIETHPMRYFFKEETETLLRGAGFRLAGFYNFMTFEPPDENCWGACFVARREG